MRTLLIAMPLLVVATVGAGSTFVKVRRDLAGQRAAIAAEWSDVDQALQQRAALIGNLADRGRELAPLPAEVLKDIADAQAVVIVGPAPQDKVQANDRLSHALAQLLVAAENYPRLRSNPEFLRIQDEIKTSEDRMAVARLKYNDSLEHYNARIQSFPHNLVARLSGFGRNDAYFPTEHF
ncbi:MAG: LemA family protein [Acidobacteriia bacterium]|nr:LemA family protein [Terriglobia bacterium]